jgi:hypothetical protein
MSGFPGEAVMGVIFIKSQTVRQLQARHPEFSIRSLKIRVDGS